MGNPQTTLWQEVTQGLAKIFIWCAYILLGVLTKIAFDSRVQRLTTKQIAVKVTLSIFAGVIAATICENTGNQRWGKVIVPVATLIGEGLTGYVMANWKKIASRLLPGWIVDDKPTKNKSSL